MFLFMCKVICAFFSEPTNAGKTIPPCLFPYVVDELRVQHSVLASVQPKCLLLTALNSIRDNILMKIRKMGLDVDIVTSGNVNDLTKSKKIRILLISPEMLSLKSVVQSLMSIREDIVIKCIDEAHLFLRWGMDRSKLEKGFRPAMKLSSGELACLGGFTLLQTATASFKTVTMLKAEFPEIKNWRQVSSVPYRDNVVIIVPPPSLVSSKFQHTLEPFITQIMDHDETHLILVRSINFGTEVYFHLVRRIGKNNVAFFHR